MLLFKYRHDSNVLQLVPTAKQLENRKQYLKMLRLKHDGGWEIDNFNVLRNWASGKLSTTREAFDKVDLTDSAAMNELIVLDTFEHTSMDSGTPVESIGLILTSRTLFRGMLKAASDQRDGVAMATDGTYRIHFGGWTLVDCGGISVQRSRASYVQTFQPWLYMFVRAECAFAYEQMFRALVNCANTFFGLDVQIAGCSIDRSDAIASALETVWPNVEILNCWEHLLRSVKKAKQVQRLKDNNYLETVVAHLKMLHLSRSVKQFRGLSKRVVRAWREAGEDNYAEWFEETYLTPRWERWFVNGSSIPGFLPTQQPIEAHHRVIKVIVSDFKKAPTETVLNSVLPRVLLYDADINSRPLHAHYCEGPLPTECVVKASAYLTSESNHQRIFARRERLIPERIIFNSSKAMIKPGSLAGSPVDTARSQRLMSSLIGRLGARAPINTANFNFLSLQNVQVARENAAALPKFQLTPTWEIGEVLLVRNAFRCTCKRYMHTGWVCAHVIASLHLLDKLDLSTAMQRIPMRGPPGMPRRIGGALTLEDPSSVDFFSTNRLIALFTEQPGRPLRWPFVEEFDVEDGDARFREHRVGQVAGCRLSDEDGFFEWSVSYLHGDILYYQVEELVQGIIRARNIGAL